MEEVNKNIERMIRKLHPNLIKIQETISKIPEYWYNIDFEELSRNYKILVNNLGGVPDRIKVVQDKLAYLGWYFISNIVFPDIRLLLNGTTEEIDRIMSNYAKSIKDEVISRVRTNYEDRYGIIRDAMKAHNSSLYSLSIPIFLIQADGICYEILNVSLYSKNNGVPKTKNAKKRITHDLDETSLEYVLFMRPLDMITSMNRNIKYGDIINKNFINRHGIIHGIDTNYHTEINSLKCIVLLKYLLDIKEEYCIS